ncbi:MAG: hypothetical protein U9N36_10205, partial [Euryarchaeota archaeon]|nr:hypothetical protein [Euryarchaeota archaeon]
ADKVTLFADLATRGIQIPDNNNHVENLMGIVGQGIKKNSQSWVDKNLEIMVNTIWQIISLVSVWNMRYWASRIPVSVTGFFSQILRAPN